MRRFKHLPSLVLVAGIFLAVTAASSSAVKFSATTNGTRQKADTGRVVPAVISRVKTLKVVGVTIEGREPTAQIVIELRNDSDRPIIAIAVESGDAKDASGVSLTGFKPADEPPTVVLKPRGTVKVRMPLSYVHPGFPVRIAGVMYADGSDEGDESALGTLRRQRDHEKNSKKEGDERPSQQ